MSIPLPLPSGKGRSQASLPPPRQSGLQGTLSALIEKSRTLNDLLQVHAVLLRRGLHQDRILNFKLQRAYSSLGCLDNSISIFNCTLDPDVFNWTAIIHSHAQLGLHDRAMVYFVDMLCSGIYPNAFTFSVALKSAPVKSGKPLHSLAFKLGFYSDLYVETGLLDVYARTGDVASAKKLFDEMDQRSLVSMTTMMTCYAKHGEIGNAKFLFDEMPDRDVVCWNVMISGYAQNGFPNEALLMFRRMLSDAKMKPDEVTVLAVISACGQIGALETGRWIHSFIENNDICINLHLGTALLDMYSKCGSLEDARLVFERMTDKDVVIWNSMISGYAMHGFSGHALETFDEMLRAGMKPNDITFVGILNACSHTGMVQEGQNLFYMMKSKYGIEPKVEHYGCLVNLLGRAGHLEEAYNIVKGMNIEPDIVIWSSLLGACGLHNDLVLGEEIAELLIKQNQMRSGTYTLLSNIYANSGNWVEVARIRSMMKSKGVEKEKGCSSIELDNTVHEFLAGDMNHPKCQEIYSMLEEINGWLRAAEDYEPQTNKVLHDLGDAEKGQSLEVHSERLAIAFGLISSRPGTTIRVVKNLRVCPDCHEVCKVISRVTGRKIIMRDRNRFHHFVDGCCSCDDFW
ncbi:hypothetical protein SAY86_030140 [Trapa natans]|uniref:DYW domain-containing protein n=1 Tax=Trapa natans TaxID=22666 RepID=A0AAN7M3A7_TRANT|nr:hypothetical protein SAY86_030140 [Trapa natans]